MSLVNASRSTEPIIFKETTGAPGIYFMYWETDGQKLKMKRARRLENMHLAGAGRRCGTNTKPHLRLGPVVTVYCARDA